MTEPKNHHLTTVLLIEDNTDVIEMVKQVLAPPDFQVHVAKTAKQAFADVFKSSPDLVILDINLPDLDGFHVARELKRNMMFSHIPIILLSGSVDFLDKMKSFDVVVDEYIVKPFQAKDLLIRTRLVLERSKNNLDANPLTRLPGNHAIVKALERKIGQGKPFAVGYCDLNSFKAFNDKYGFSKGDEVIIFTAQTIVSIVQTLSTSEKFVGHVGGDDFIFISSYEEANKICEKIIETFDKGIPRYYSEEDRKKGFLVVEDRRGVVSQFPLMSIAIGLVSDEGKKFQNLGQVNHSLTQLKKYAKSFQGSAFVRDRRTLTQQLAEFTWGAGSNAGSSKVLEAITDALGSYLPGQLSDIIKRKLITVLFQPILEMKDDEVFGIESLVRGPSGTPLEYPDALFQTARTTNCVLDLDILCMKQILDMSREIRHGIKLFINIFPETLADIHILQKEILDDPRTKALDLVFELAGANRASDINELFNTLGALRETGQKICVDTSFPLLGSGMKHIAALRPDYVKLNMSYFRDLSGDKKKENEFLETVNEIRAIGSIGICTKLESRADSFLALKAGIQLGQGFLFARPAQNLTHSSLK